MVYYIPLLTPKKIQWGNSVHHEYSMDTVIVHSHWLWLWQVTWRWALLILWNTTSHFWHQKNKMRKQCAPWICLKYLYGHYDGALPVILTLVVTGDMRISATGTMVYYIPPLTPKYTMRKQRAPWIQYGHCHDALPASLTLVLTGDLPLAWIDCISLLSC